MTIRIGANPIGWSNDDLQEIGGDDAARDLPRRGPRGRHRGHGARQQVSARGRRRSRPRSRPSAWPASAAGIRSSCSNRSAREEFDLAKPHRELLRPWARTSSSWPRRPTPSTASADCRCRGGPMHGRRRLGRLRGQDHRAGRTARRRGAEGSATTTTWARSSQSEADIDAFMAHTRAAGESAARHRPRHLGRLRPGGARAPLPRPHQPRPLQGRAPRRKGAGATRRTGASSTRFSAKGAELGIYTVPGDGIGRLRRGVQGAAGLFGLGGGRGRAGPRKGQPARLRQDGRRQLKRFLAEAGLR